MEINQVGRPRKFSSPEEFRELCIGYFKWVKDNPVEKTITAAFRGEITYEKVPHQRPMTQYGLASYLGVGLRTLHDYGARPEYSHIFASICNYMTAWNIDGATSGDFNGNIVARLEGLADKQEMTGNVTVEPKGLDDFYGDS